MRLVVSNHANHVRDQFESAGRRVDCIMVTLTYAPFVAYDRKQISEYVKRMRGWFETRKIPYAYQWVLEMQRRGAPHYHVLWWVPSGQQLPMPDRRSPRQRKALWPWGMTRIEKARCGPAYITKYASKGDQCRRLPHGARLFGLGGFEEAKKKAQWRALPAFVREQTESGERVRRARGGGWLSLDTGGHFPSQWFRHIAWRDGRCWVVMRRRNADDARRPVHRMVRLHD